MELWTYNEHHTEATEGGWQLIPEPQDRDSENFNGTFEAVLNDSGTARIETTALDPEIMAKIIAGTATPGEEAMLSAFPWTDPAGENEDVSESTQRSIDKTITAFRCITDSSSGEDVDTWFNVRIEK